MSYLVLFFFVKQNTAYEMRISDWSSDVCSSVHPSRAGRQETGDHDAGGTIAEPSRGNHMRKSILSLSAVALAALSAPAFAQDAPTPELTVTGNAARKGVGEGESVSERVGPGGRQTMKKKKSALENKSRIE